MPRNPDQPPLPIPSRVYGVSQTIVSTMNPISSSVVSALSDTAVVPFSSMAPQNAAPSIPIGVAAKIATREKRIAHLCNHAISDPSDDNIGEIEREALAYTSIVESQEAPGTIARRERTLASWYTLVHFHRPHMDPEMHWHVATVKYFAPLYLHFWVRLPLLACFVLTSLSC
jgi:hypothetical protein